jgi:hypothetical protein
VPEHQKWMNGGKFDGGLLSDEQKQLRQFYSDLLNLSRTNKAISSGAYYDITAFNIQAKNFGEDVHAFVRYAGEDKLVIVTGYNEQAKAIKVKIPDDVAEKIGMKKDGVFIARDLLWREVEVGLKSDFSFELNLKPYSSFILKVKE